MVDMKKIFLIIGLFLICAGVGFGSAMGEEHSFKIVDSQGIANTDVLNYTYVFKPEGYAFDMEFEMTNQGGYLLLRKNGQYYDLNSEEIFVLLGERKIAAEALFSTYAAENQNFNIELFDMDDNLENVKGNATDINLSNIDLELFNLTDERLKFLIETLQDWEHQELLFFVENGNNDKCIYLSFNVKHGFFAQELEFLNALENGNNETYETKALALMYLAMGDMQNQFITTIEKYQQLFNSNINLNYIQNAVLTEDFSLGNLRAYLQLGFVNYFNYTLNKKTTVLNSNDHFKMKFYDREKRSPYALAYSLFSFDLNKPILSSLNYTQTNWNFSIAANNDIQTNTTKITETQAELIVQNAMYYYNWAYEYTLTPFYDVDNGIYEKLQNIVFNDSFEPSSKNNKSTEMKEPIKSWMSQRYKPYEFEFAKYNFLAFPGNSSSVAEVGQLFLFGSNTVFEQYLRITKFDVFSNELLRTPFRDGNNQSVFGNPVPYVKGGIDSPRTFNRKMYDQWLTNDEIYWANDLNYTTKAISDILRQQNTITSINFINYDVYSSYKINKVEPNHKPFRPGMPNIKNPFNTGNFAGVDSIGFLLGTASMSGLEVFDKNAVDKSNILTTHFSFLNGYPEYDINNYNDMRIDIYDLENQSILVPDLSLMRKGDFLIDTSNQEDPHIGIILKSNSADFSLNETYVLSIGKAHRIMTLGKWLNTETVYNSFSTNPRTYQIRRLIQYSSNSDNNAIPVWDLIQFPKNYVMDIKKIEGTHVMSHWIPNTKIDDPNSGEITDVIYEPLIFDKIEIYNKIGRKILPLKMGSKIAVMPPKDMYWDDEPDDIVSPATNNIFKNKGSGIELVALRKDNQGNDVMVTVAQFVINSDADSPLSAYEISNVDTDLVDGNGNMIEGYSLITEGITLKLKDQNDNAFIQFGVRINDESYRPGDDFLLRFKVVETETDITATDGDFIAVYDKKMLWRANLYIDEKVDVDDGAVENNTIDWNNVESNKWIVGNEWNYNFVFDTLHNYFHNKQNEFRTDRDSTGVNRLHEYIESADVTIPLLTIGNGEQSLITFNGFTWSWNHANGWNFYGRVAYDWDGDDGPFEFNYKMENQKVLLNQFYRNNNLAPFIRERISWPDTFTNINDLWGRTYSENDWYSNLNMPFSSLDQIRLDFANNEISTWSYYDKYVAPGTNHSNYIHGTNYDINILFKTITANTELDSVYVSKNFSFLSIDLTDNNIDDPKRYYPYLPGLTNNITKQWPNAGEGSTDWITAGYTAGTDCIGFATRAASYMGNIYLWDERWQSRMWSESRKASPAYPYNNSLSWTISSHNHDDNEDLNGDDKPDVFAHLNKIVPGDIIYYTSNINGTSGAGHIMIVSYVTYDNNGRETTLTGITRIESSDGGPNNGVYWGYAVNTKNLQEKEGKDKNWFVVRLRPNP